MSWFSAYLQTPWLLGLLGLLPLLWWLDRRWQRQRPALRTGSLAAFSGSVTWRIRLYRWSKWIQYLGAALVIIAVARPQLPLQEQQVDAESVEIALIMDLSSSMLAQDFQPNRLEASKSVATQFIRRRPYDLFALVVFAAESFTPSPLTADHTLVIQSLQALECGVLEDGTAIGMGLANAVNRLRNGQAKSRIAILLTDGVNNSGYIQPLTATQLARELNIKVYTIGVGTQGEALSPVSRRADGQYVFGYTRVEIDETLLRQIAQETGGKYYRATDQTSLERIYAEIDRLEKTKVHITTIKTYTEYFRHFLVAGLLLMALELFIRQILIKRAL